MRWPHLVLATDLDGTLAGPHTGCEAALGAMLAHERITLIYVTGRGVDSARTLIAREGLPAPAFLVADIGTSVLRGLGPSRIEAVEREIERAWPGAANVEARMAGIPGVERQSIAAPRRASYWITANRALRAGGDRKDDFEARPGDDPSLSPAAAATAQFIGKRVAAALHDLSVDVLISGNVYIDILPRGVNKGTTLRRVLQEAGASVGSCVVAGDSLNDRSLFDIGAAGIAVGNCEPALRAALRYRPDVYVARQAGACGILEGLRHFNALPAEREFQNEARHAE